LFERRTYTQMVGTWRLTSAAVLKLTGASGIYVAWTAYDPGASALAVALGTVLPALLAVALMLTGGWVLAADRLDKPAATSLLRWTAVGMLGIGSLGAMALFLQAVGYVIDSPVFVLTTTVVTGALAGFGIGWYELWERRRAHELEREREKLDHLNRLLRHHLLNGMNVLLAKVDLARERSDDPVVSDDLDDAHLRGREAVALVEQVSSIAGPDDHSPSEVDLARLLRNEVERIRTTRGKEFVSLDEPLPEVTVRSSPALGEAVGVLLEDALVVGANSSATVSAAAVDDGVDISVSTPSNAAPDGGEQLLGGPGSDVGLSVADVLVERAGGELVSGTADGTVRIHLQTV
jgi:two-component system OmpR family sensor kinase